ncbi:MAG TPA: hypothetical protein VK879_21660 [Candidatus Sulfomarinibacteraceae bacterium]|nr:hypothetical protein [Candidatus Sulfomarinibacteraceae bacterium]
MMPIVNGLEDKFGSEISVVRLDAIDSESAALQGHYGLRGHPSFVVLDASGDVIERFFGPQSEETLRAAIELALEPSS